MPDIRGLVADPDFRKLPEERQRALLSQVGADPQFIEEIVPTLAGAGAALAGAEGISETPGFQKSLGEAKFAGPFAPGIPLPSAETLTEFLPGLGAALGLAAGAPTGGLASPVLAGLGSGAGEAIRQGIREKAGFAPGTGMGQELLGLDPESKTAQWVGMLNEIAGGATAEALGPLASKAAGGLQKSGVKTYAKGLGAKTLADEKQFIKRIGDIVDEPLPTGPLRRIERIAGDRADEAGAEVGRIYDIDQPSSFSPAREALAEADEALTRAKPHYTESGKLSTRNVVDPQMHEAIQDRSRKLMEAELKMKSAGTPPDIKAVHEARKQADREAVRAKSTVFNPGTKNVSPGADAAVKERRALSNILHEEVPGSASADARAAAWNTVASAAHGGDVSHFIARWGLSRVVGGTLGTGVGIAAAAPATIRTAVGKLEIELARAINAGNKPAARQAARAMMDMIVQPEEEE